MQLQPYDIKPSTTLEVALKVSLAQLQYQTLCSGGCSGFGIHNPSILSPQMVQAYCSTKNYKAAWYSPEDSRLCKLQMVTSVGNHSKFQHQYITFTHWTSSAVAVAQFHQVCFLYTTKNRKCFLSKQFYSIVLCPKIVQDFPFMVKQVMLFTAGR